MVYKVTFTDERDGQQKTIKLHSQISLQQTLNTLRANSWRYSDIHVRESSPRRFNDVVIIVEG